MGSWTSYKVKDSAEVIQPYVFFAADNCHLSVGTKKAMNFKEDIYWNPNGNLKNPYVLVINMTLLQVATENCLYADPVGEQQRLEPNFIFP